MDLSWVYRDAASRWARYSERIDHLARVIADADPDVVAFQEVRHDDSFGPVGTASDGHEFGFEARGGAKAEAATTRRKSGGSAASAAGVSAGGDVDSDFDHGDFDGDSDGDGGAELVMEQQRRLREVMGLAGGSGGGGGGGGGQRRGPRGGAIFEAGSPNASQAVHLLSRLRGLGFEHFAYHPASESSSRVVYTSLPRSLAPSLARCRRASS